MENLVFESLDELNEVKKKNDKRTKTKVLGIYGKFSI